MEGAQWFISFLIFLLIWLIFSILSRNLALYGIQELLEDVEIYERTARLIVLRNILRAKLKAGMKQEELDKEFKRVSRVLDEAMESFFVFPVTLEPTELMKRLEHVLNVRESRLKNIVRRILPDAEEAFLENMQRAMEALASLRSIRKLLRHYYEITKRTASLILIYQLQFMASLIKPAVKALYDAVRSFVVGVPIGDSVGPAVATMLLSRGSTSIEEYADDGVVVGTTEYKGRELIVIKARGPGANVGHPSRALEKLLKEHNVKAVIMVDASIRLEGETSGEVAIGFGAAIGDIGPEKYRIERICAEKGILLFAVIIKESIVEALTPMSESVAKGVSKAYEEVLRLIEEETSPGDSVVVIGVGNSVGVGLEVETDAETTFGF